MGLLGTTDRMSEPAGNMEKIPQLKESKIKAAVLAIFNARDNIPEAIFQKLLGAIEVSGGTMQEIKNKVDNAVAELENEGLIRFDPETREFSKVKNPETV